MPGKKKARRVGRTSPPGRFRRSGTTRGASAGNRRKTYQLCHQVAEALNDAFAGQLDNDVLRDLMVASVSPAPDDSRLLVTLAPAVPGQGVDPILALASLSPREAELRTFVASAITRRKVPVLVYQVAPGQPQESVPDDRSPNE